MNVVIIHAHHEPKSFSSALKERAVDTFVRLGHEVEVSDLWAMGFDPVSDRRNFTASVDGVYLKQQREERFATDHDGFAREITAEMEKVLRADLLIFNFPLWWFGMPATLKGWVDRVFAYGKMYGGGKHYEHGFAVGKRALVTITTGSAAASFNGFGHHPSMSSILAPIHHGIFWFNGFAPLPPFISYAVEYLTSNERARVLDDYERHLSTLDERSPIVLPRKGDFDPETFADRLGRWMIEVRGARVIDDASVAERRRDGTLLAAWFSEERNDERVAWLVVRAPSREVAHDIARTVARDESTTYVVRKLAQPIAASLAYA